MKSTLVATAVVVAASTILGAPTANTKRDAAKWIYPTLIKSYDVTTDNVFNNDVILVSRDEEYEIATLYSFTFPTETKDKTCGIYIYSNPDRDDKHPMFGNLDMNVFQTNIQDLAAQAKGDSRGSLAGSVKFDEETGAFPFEDNSSWGAAFPCPAGKTAVFETMLAGDSKDYGQVAISQDSGPVEGVAIPNGFNVYWS